MFNMRNFLEAVDQFAGQAVGQKPGDQVRGTEKARMGAKDHPFKGRLVGAAEDRDQSILKELEAELSKPVRKDLGREYAEFKKGQVNLPDVIKVDVPLLIRIMEYAREDAKDDMALHDVAEQLIKLSTEGRTLTMQDYDTIIGTVNEYGGTPGYGAQSQAPQGTTTQAANPNDPAVKQAKQDQLQIQKSTQNIAGTLNQQGAAQPINKVKFQDVMTKLDVAPNTNLTNQEQNQLGPLAVAASKIIQNPQTAGQFKQLMSKADQTERAKQAKVQKAQQQIGTNAPAGQQQQQKTGAQPGQKPPTG